MKTTVELPDELLRRARAEAARRGLDLKDLVQEGLRKVLSSSGVQRSDNSAGERSSLFALVKDGAGIVDSGIADLASNPKHIEGFGRDSMGDR